MRVVAFILMAISFACGSSLAATRRELSFSAEVIENTISFKLENVSGRPVRVMLPMIITYDGSHSGVEWIIMSDDGHLHPLCGNFQPLAMPVPSSLAPRDGRVSSIEIGEVASLYCLAAGRYTATAVFHSRIDGKRRSVRSNAITLTIRRPD